MFLRSTASTIASASTKSFLFDFTNGLRRARPRHGEDLRSKLGAMANPTLTLFTGQIESVETNIQPIELRIAQLSRRTSRNGDLTLETQLLRTVQDEYRRLLLTLRNAAAVAQD